MFKMKKNSPYNSESDEVFSTQPTETGKDSVERFRRSRSGNLDSNFVSSFQDSTTSNATNQSILNSIEKIEDDFTNENREIDPLNNSVESGSQLNNFLNQNTLFNYQIENVSQISPQTNFVLPLVALKNNLDNIETSTQDEDDSIMEDPNLLRTNFINRTNSESSSESSSSSDTSSDNSFENVSSLNNSLPIDLTFRVDRYHRIFKSRSNQPIQNSEQAKHSDKDCGCFQGLTGIGIQDDSQFCFLDSKNPSNVLIGLNDLRQNKLLCDVILKVENEEFYCHKCVLASLSSYFRAMFYSDLIESRLTKISLNELEPNTMKLIIDYAYTSKLNINEENVQALLSSANLFDIKPLREACCRYMEWRMDEQNCIVQHEEYLALTPPKLIDIIKNDNLKVPSEDYVYEACVKWLEHSINDRISSFHKILEHVRLPLLKPYFLYDKVQNNQLLKKSDECNLLIKEAFDYNFLKDRRNQIQNQRTRSRKFFKHLESLIIICGENEEYVLRTVEAYIPSLTRWLGLRHFPFSLTKSGVVATEETILYIAGGERSDLDATDFFWQYNSILDEWKELQSMQTHRSELGLAIVDGCVYAIGGKNLQGSALDSVECYDPLLNIWKYCAVMSTPLVNPAVCSLNGLLYVIADKFNQYYNPSTNTWTEFPKPLTPRFGSRACSSNGKIYLVGGFTNEITNLVECFDPVTNTWERCPSMIESRRHPGVAILNNQIFVCGGENSSGEVSNTIEAYDFETNKWNFVTVMKKERSWLSCASLRLENPLSNPLSDSNYNELPDSISNSV